LLDWLHIIEANGPGYRLRQSKKRLQKPDPDSKETNSSGSQESRPDDT